MWLKVHYLWELSYENVFFLLGELTISNKQKSSQYEMISIINVRNIRTDSSMEEPTRFELVIKVLQTYALATWLRLRINRFYYNYGILSICNFPIFNIFYAKTQKKHLFVFFILNLNSCYSNCAYNIIDSTSS